MAQRARFWDIQNAERLITLERIQPSANIARLSYSADGLRLYGALDRNRGAAIWDANTGRLISKFDLTPINSNAFTTNDLNGSMFVRNNYDEQSYWIEIWNLDEQSFMRVDSPGRETSPLQLSLDGSLLFATNDNRLFAWMSVDGALIYRSATRDFELEELAINQDNTLMALSTHEHVVVWDTNGIANRALAEFIPTVVPLPTATESYSWPTSTPMPPILITPIPLQNLPEGAISPEQAVQVVELARLGAGRIAQVIWAGDSWSVTVTGSLGVDQYSLQAEDEFGEPVHYPSDLWVSSTVRLADGRSLAAGSDGKRVRVWDLDSGERLVDLEGGESRLSARMAGCWFSWAETGIYIPGICKPGNR